MRKSLILHFPNCLKTNINKKIQRYKGYKEELKFAFIKFKKYQEYIHKKKPLDSFSSTL